MSEANPKAGEHGFSGACCPARENDWGNDWGMETFSVGIFEWRPKCSNNNILKKGAVKVRVRGYCQNPEAVYIEARRIMELLNAGKYDGPKNVKV